MTYGIIKSINAKDKLYKKVVQNTPGTLNYETDKINLKTYKSIIRRSIMQAKRQYYHTTFNRYSNDLKKTWQTINTTLNKKTNKKKYPPEIILENGDKLVDHKAIADAFNAYFVNIGESTIDHLNMPINAFDSYLNNKPTSTLHFETISIHTTLQIIDSLKPKTSTGIDLISNKLIKFMKEIIAEPVTIIINQMLNTGIFPESLKISKVIPLYKKDDDTVISNYRPISLLSSISKLFEKAVLLQITNYFDNNHLINVSQYGFRKQHSTELASLQLVDFFSF